MVDVSVVVCTRNGAPRVRAHLGTVAAAVRAAGVEAELIVVDNGSTDDTVTAARQAASDVHIVLAPKPGLARARNAGVIAARGRAVLFTDDDVDTPIDWVTRMSTPLLDDHADIVVGGIRVDDSLRKPWMSPWLLAQFADHPEPDAVDAFVVGANFGAQVSVLRSLPFDEHLGAAPYQREEDAFFWVQAVERGLRIHGVQGTPVRHCFEPDRLETGALLRMAETMGRCQAYVWHHWLHGDAPHLRLKAAAYRTDLALRPVSKQHHPSDEDMKRIARLSFVRELRKIADTPRNYPAPSVRRLSSS
jgi:hypothetical protein